jgi:hypothetical protein
LLTRRLPRARARSRSKSKKTAVHGVAFFALAPGASIVTFLLLLTHRFGGLLLFTKDDEDFQRHLE